MVETVLGLTDLQIRFFTAFGQTVVAVAVGMIAYRQWRTARNKLKFDLFTRRLEAYNRVREATTRAIAADWREEADHDVFLSLRDVRWLFGQSVYDFVWKELYEPVVDLWDVKTTIAEPGVLSDPEVRKARDAAILRRRELRHALTRSMTRLDEVMGEYLTLSH
ncbi:TPA: hypothetical protein ACG4N3_000564 [Stenotrophomonas maltophilia]|uniref:hypothetical protein n=1 Tax=Stenotrophomonas maltophilia TaxID=40324 RepID=UPI000748B5C2|nr:hypothetical protein [Stenotrophomonas maltophilia]KUP03528.1 hypothetical protein AR274_21630 [Stenotrophomonas maltophilia]KZC91440.1 hypothetical protein AR273_16235 [Stenotrophomonas maltophilia]MBN4952826.1 hypothetical protein [Stenotrophomonas maltophilia]MCU1151271.1 hypothetical protein [Stenotrophomonas maltophilia]UXB21761.1 hypothetical protein K7566_08695 [Stenotrophomonas maltophilia]